MMSEAIAVALITSGLSLLGTIITVVLTNNKTREDLKISQAVMDTKITELTREVRAHNNFAQRMPVVEEQIRNLSDRVRDLETRSEDDGR